MSERLTPKLFTTLKTGYGSKQLLDDVLAGLIVGIVALPLALAFAIASGVKPEQGLYTAIIAGFVISLLGGSRVQISGPTGAFIVVVYGIVTQYGYEGLAVATLLAGIILVAVGLAGMGVLLKFVPYPLTIGFTSGIAIIIFSSQVKDFLGLRIEALPADFLEKWAAILSSISSADLSACCIGMMTLLIVAVAPRFVPKIPGPLIAIVAATAVVSIFKLPIDTIGSRFGEVPHALPVPRMPNADWETIKLLFPSAITIALLGGIESLLSASVADGMLGTRHRSDMELVAQGVGNIVSPLFLGIPATGAIARTATNVKSGGRTPVSGLVHAATLLFIMLFFGGWAALVPIASLSGILIFVAYNMSEWHAFVHILKYPKGDVVVLLTTFFLTVLIDLRVAIEVGIALSAFLFVKGMDNATQVTAVTEELRAYRGDSDQPDESIAATRRGVEVFEVFGPLFFCAIERFRNAMSRIEGTPKVLIILMRHTLVIDGSGIQAIESLLDRAKREGSTVLLAELHDQPLEAIRRAGIIPEAQIYQTLGAALKSAES